MRASRGPQSFQPVFYLLEIKPPEKINTLYVSPGIESLLGCSPEDFKIEVLIERIDKRDRQNVAPLTQLVTEEKELERAYRLRNKEGDVVLLKEYIAVVERSDETFKVAGLLTVVNEREDIKDFILQNIPDLIVLIDRRGFVKFSAGSFKRVLGLSTKEVKGKLFMSRVHPSEREGLLRMINKVYQTPGQEAIYVFRVLDKSCNYSWMEGTIILPKAHESEGIKGAVMRMRKLPDQNDLEWAISKAVNYDPLTGLPNRYLFTENLAEYLNLLKRKGEMAAILVINIYRFREVNATFGMRIGDEILKKVASRLLKTLRTSDLVGRFMADEFCIALLGIKTLTGINVAVEKVKNVFREPFVVDGNQVFLDINIGVSTFPIDGEEVGELIRKAEAALAKSREGGPGTVSYFSESIEEEIRGITTIRNALGEALEKREIVPYYQPVFSLREGKLIGVEALARWESPDLGTLDPARFISVAEDTGLIVDIGYCILNQAVRDISTINGQGIKLSLGVNFSARQFNDDSLPYKVREILEAYRFPPERFIMEITESTAMREPEKTREILLRMRGMGLKLAIDDFGTGYSSMNYLMEFEVDKIKIDKSFVLNMKNNQKAERVVSTIINLTKSIGARSLAEGVENREIFEKLVKLGCDEGQGFYFAKPMSFDKLREYVSERL